MDVVQSGLMRVSRPTQTPVMLICTAYCNVKENLHFYLRVCWRVLYNPHSSHRSGGATPQRLVNINSETLTAIPTVSGSGKAYQLSENHLSPRYEATNDGDAIDGNPREFFWLVNLYRRFEGTWCLHLLQCRAVIKAFLVWHPRRPESSTARLCENLRHGKHRLFPKEY